MEGNVCADAAEVGFGIGRVSCWREFGIGAWCAGCWGDAGDGGGGNRSCVVVVRMQQMKEILQGVDTDVIVNWREKSLRVIRSLPFGRGLSMFGLCVYFRALYCSEL